MSKTVLVMEWESDDTSHGNKVYRVDEPGAGDRFFRDLQNNAETDGRECFTLVEMTEEQWQECVRNGEEHA